MIKIKNYNCLIDKAIKEQCEVIIYIPSNNEMLVKIRPSKQDYKEEEVQYFRE